MRVESEYLERENNARIEAQQQILILNKQIIKRQRSLNILIGVISIILIMVAVLLMYINNQRKQINRLLDQKVKERTKELELSRDQLLKITQERSVHTKRTVDGIKGSLATIKGLCAIGLKDIDDPNAKEYIVKVYNTSNELSIMLQNLQ